MGNGYSEYNCNVHFEDNKNITLFSMKLVDKVMLSCICSIMLFMGSNGINIYKISTSAPNI